MTQHTPGPWKVIFKHGPSGSTDYYNIIDTEGKKIAEIKDTGDARLIAAAPEMLEALRMACVMLAKGDGVSYKDRKKAHEACIVAIAKATGEA